MASNTFDITILEASIKETEFTEDIVTQCLTAICSECKGEYVNLVLRHKFVCKCSCHKLIGIKQLPPQQLDNGVAQV